MFSSRYAWERGVQRAQVVQDSAARSDGIRSTVARLSIGARIESRQSPVRDLLALPDSPLRRRRLVKRTEAVLLFRSGAPDGDFELRGRRVVCCPPVPAFPAVQVAIFSGLISWVRISIQVGTTIIGPT